MNYSRITLEAGMMMKKASNDDSPLQHGAGLPGRASECSQTRVDDGGGYRTFHGWRLGPLGFSRGCEFIGGKARLVDAQGAHTMGRCGQGVGRATTRCGRLVAHFRLSFGLLRVSKIGTSAFVSSNSENISFGKTWNRKTSKNRN
jgi:hypothetical protein